MVKTSLNTKLPKPKTQQSPKSPTETPSSPTLSPILIQMVAPQEAPPPTTEPNITTIQDQPIPTKEQPQNAEEQPEHTEEQPIGEEQQPPIAEKSTISTNPKPIETPMEVEKPKSVPHLRGTRINKGEGRRSQG